MIRFVYIGDQVNEDEKEFAFFNTVTNTFIEFDGRYTFRDEKHFAEYAINSEIYERCLNLIPDWYQFVNPETQKYYKVPIIKFFNEFITCELPSIDPNKNNEL